MYKQENARNEFSLKLEAKGANMAFPLNKRNTQLSRERSGSQPSFFRKKKRKSENQQLERSVFFYYHS